MIKDMLSRALANKEHSGATNVEFIKSQISKVALEDGVADCIISNCVINLVPEADKPEVFKEAFRLLKPGGRVAISDILAKRALTDDIKNDVALLAGCIAGASEVADYEMWMNAAGFESMISIHSMSL